MLNQVRTFFRAPTFPDDEDKTRKARYANAIASTFLAITIVYETIVRALVGYKDLSPVDMIIIGLAVICIVGLVLLRKGYVYFTSVLLVVLIWGAINGIAATGYGVRDSSYITNFTIILMAGLLLGWQASLIVTILSVFSGYGLAYAEQNGLISTFSYPVTTFAQDITFVLGFNAVIIYLLINGLENALKRSRGSLEKLASVNVDLNHAQNELQNRTSELLISNKQLENRTEKLRAIAEVTSTAASIHSFETLLSSIASIVSKQLGYYHVGVFLLDKQTQYAILRSASSEGGLKMLMREYRVQVGQQAIIGFVAQTGRPHIALDTNQDGTFIVNPDLPDTRSEMALPLKSGNQIIGILDLQSSEANAFSRDDISTLSILADQIGIAIQNALVYEQSQRALQEANIAFMHASEREWQGYAETVQTRGYRYDGIRAEPLKEVASSLAAPKHILNIPVRLHGQTIGNLKLKPSDVSREWTEDELAMAEATAERTALALDGARLLDDAQKRAARETFLSDMAAKLSTSFQLDSILRDTVEELGQTLKGSTVSFQLVNPSAPISVETQPDDAPLQQKKSE
jgi:GAF domain-containing protein